MRSPRRLAEAFSHQRRAERARLRRRLRRGAAGERGVTLVELGLALMIGSLVMSSALITFTAFSTTTEGAVQLGSADMSATAVVQQLQSELVSANILFNPATEGLNAGTSPDGAAIPAGFSLRIYTQFNGVPTCMQWRALDTGVLQSRRWTDTTPPAVTAWHEQITGLVNPPSTPPFALDSSSQYGGRLLDVTLEVKTVNSSSVTVSTALTARNAQFFNSASNDVADCTPVPTP